MATLLKDWIDGIERMKFNRPLFKQEGGEDMKKTLLDHRRASGLTIDEVLKRSEIPTSRLYTYSYNKPKSVTDINDYLRLLLVLEVHPDDVLDVPKNASMAELNETVRLIEEIKKLKA